MRGTARPHQGPLARRTDQLVTEPEFGHQIHHFGPTADEGLGTEIQWLPSDFAGAQHPADPVAALEHDEVGVRSQALSQPMGRDESADSATDDRDPHASTVAGHTRRARPTPPPVVCWITRTRRVPDDDRLGTVDPIAFDSDLGSGWDIAHAAAGRPGDVEIVGFRDRDREGMDMRIVPGPIVTIVLDFGEYGLAVDTAAGRQVTGGVVAGLAPGAARIRSPRVECVEVRLSPVRAYSLFGTALPALVDAEDVWGASAYRLRERLATAPTWARRFAMTGEFVAQRRSFAADPEVVGSWQRIVASGGTVRVAELTELCGWSRKRLWSRFTAQIGLTPKRAAMLVRFDRAVGGLLAGTAIAEVAARCGYVDQAHLHRDVLAFAGRTPRALAEEHSSKTGGR